MISELVILGFDKLMPRDEAAHDASFVTFRKSLTAALKKGNDTWVVSRIDPDVRISFGEENGKAALLSSWKRSPSAKAAFLKELLLIVGLGGGFREGSFWAPYTYAFWPDELDAFENAVAAGARVELKESMSPASKTLAVLSYDIVRLVPEDSRVSTEWRRIEHRGKKGFARTGEVRSGADARACFTKVKGSWRLTAFVAGD
ncbi:MAG: hypothetical protein JST30_12770 [Armatimonadetes bacterium]|nr:hypothetical protein [Armatimonadota bacterium]